MPSQRKHWLQAEHNRTLAEDLITETPMKYKDWAVIVGFYSAVHLIESCRDYFDGSHSDDHGDRRKWVTQYLPCIDNEYRQLYHTSLMLRYLVHEGTDYKPRGEWLSDDVAIDFISNDLSAILKESSKFMNLTTTSSGSK